MNIDFATRIIEFGGPSTQWWPQFATAVAGGLAFSTLLALGTKMGEKHQTRQALRQQKRKQKRQLSAVA